MFTHLSIKFLFLFVCVAASEGVGKESWVCVCSSASNMPSQLRHLRDGFCISLQSILSLLSDKRSGRLHSDFSGDTFLELFELVDNCSQLCEEADKAFSIEDWRFRRGLTGGSVCMSGSSQSALSLPRLSHEAMR